MPRQLEADFGPQLWSGPHAEFLAGCSLVMGMHPDQARVVMQTPLLSIIDVQSQVIQWLGYT